MAADKYKICSLALTEIGMQPIVDFNDAGNINAATICGEMWDDYSRFLLSIYSWRFNTTKIELAQLVQAPLNQWRYQYQLPADMLNMRAVYANDSQHMPPLMRYEVFEHQLYADTQQVFVDYQKYFEPNLWPPYFTKFAIKAIAADLATIMTDKIDLANLKRQEAYGPPQDNGQGGIFGMAKRIDSQMMPVTPITSFSLLEARFS